MGVFDGIATGILGGITGALGSESQNRFNSAQASDNRNFQMEMSNTAYQRATTDMQKAGINPMLAYMQGGASGGGGAQASGSNSGEAAVAGAQAATQSAINQASARAAEANADKAETEADIADATKGDVIKNFSNSAKKSTTEGVLSQDLTNALGIFSSGKAAKNVQPLVDKLGEAWGDLKYKKPQDPSRVRSNIRWKRND